MTDPIPPRPPEDGRVYWRQRALAAEARCKRLRDELAESEARGAERMRERAALLCDTYGTRVESRECCVCAQEIRAMPLDGDSEDT